MSKPRVKPLEFVPVGDHLWIATLHPFGPWQGRVEYRIEFWPNDPSETRYSADRMAQFASYAEAEADCQARHRASVLALLEPTP